MEPGQGRTAAAAAAATAAVLLSVAPALAGTRAQAVTSSEVTAGRWGAAAVSTGSTSASASGHVITWPVPLAAQYFEAWNNGTLALTGTTWTATNSKPSGNAPPEIAFDACDGGLWSTTLGTCSGTVVRIGSTSGGTLTVSSPTTARAAGSRVHVRALPVSLLNFPQTFTTTVTLSVARNQVRAAGTTHS